MTASLDPRLDTALGFVRNGAVLCDVGTDHAYLPIAALLSGKCVRALATDINKGPLERARKNASLAGLSRGKADDPIQFALCDGLDDALLSEKGVTDLVICGMGGELIWQILSRSAYPKKEGVRLILQPMTKARELRKGLTEGGFCILDEALSLSGGKLYTCICAEYRGVPDYFTEVELLLGRCSRAHGGELFVLLCERELAALQKRVDGLLSGGHDASQEQALMTEIERILKF